MSALAKIIARVCLSPIPRKPRPKNHLTLILLYLLIELKKLLRYKEGAMRTIEVDFDVYKELMYLRKSEEVTFNDVLRDLLKLGPAKKPEPTVSTPSTGTPWISKGVSFPNGTEFRATYKGQVHNAVVDNGALVVGGKRFNSPSAAAVDITGTSVNGWRFWECKRPGHQGWTLITNLRRG
jgi:hypothetical protein